MRVLLDDNLIQVCRGVKEDFLGNGVHCGDIQLKASEYIQLAAEIEVHIQEGLMEIVLPRGAENYLACKRATHMA